jgi:hypothetical protein
MLLFRTSSRYIDALAGDPSLAVVSIGNAASALGITRATVERMLEDKRLTEIRIEKVRCVRAYDIINFSNQRARDVQAVRKLLEKSARQKKAVFYNPVMKAINLSWRNPPDRKKIGGILGEISESTYKESRGRLLLSVIVHRKSKGNTLPSGSFFDLARSLGYNFSDEQQFADKMLKRVFEHYTR